MSMSYQRHQHRQPQPQPQQMMMMGGWSGGYFNNMDTIYTKIFVGGLAWETQKDTMRNYFEQFGEIVEAVVITDKATGRSKGYGFVTFKEAEAAFRACQNPSPVIDGRRANCNLAFMGAVANKNHHQPASPYIHGSQVRFRGAATVVPSPAAGGLVAPTPAFPAAVVSSPSSSSTTVYFQQHQPSSAHLTFPPPYSSAAYGYTTGFSHDSMYPNTNYYGGVYGGGQPLLSQYYYPAAAGGVGGSPMPGVGGYSQGYYPYYSPYANQMHGGGGVNYQHHHPSAMLYNGGGGGHYTPPGLDFLPSQLPQQHQSAGILSLPDTALSVPTFGAGIKTVTGVSGTGSRSTGQSQPATSEQNSSTTS